MGAIRHIAVPIGINDVVAQRTQIIDLIEGYQKVFHQREKPRQPLPHKAPKRQDSLLFSGNHKMEMVIHHLERDNPNLRKKCRRLSNHIHHKHKIFP